MIDKIAPELGLEILELPLWAERFPKPILDALELESPRAHRRGRRQEAYSDAEKWFPSFERLCVVYGLDYRSLPWRSWRYMAGADPSGKRRKGNALVAAGEARDGRKVITEVRIGAWTSPEFMEQIADVDAIFRPQGILFESVALQESILEWTRYTRGAGIGATADWWTRLSGYETKGTINTDEWVGLKALEAEFSNGAWILPIAHEKRPGCDCGPCELVRQVTQHPHGKQHDALMALWFCREGFVACGQPASTMVANTEHVAGAYGPGGSWADEGVAPAV